MKSDTASSLRSRRCWGLLAEGSALRNASRTIRRCTLNFRDTPAIVPTPNSKDKIYAVIQQGSRTTINEELKAWRVDKSKPEVPKELLDLWSGTVKRAEEVFAQDRECMEAEVAEANRQGR